MTSGRTPSRNLVHSEPPSRRLGKIASGSWCSLVSTLACQARGRGFKSRRPRHTSMVARARCPGSHDPGRRTRVSASGRGSLSPAGRREAQPATSRGLARVEYVIPPTDRRAGSVDAMLRAPPTRQASPARRAGAARCDTGASSRCPRARRCGSARRTALGSGTGPSPV